MTKLAALNNIAGAVAFLRRNLASVDWESQSRNYNFKKLCCVGPRKRNETESVKSTFAFFASLLKAQQTLLNQIQGAFVGVTKESLVKGRISTVDLLVLNSSDQLFFLLKLKFSFYTKQPTLMRRSTVLSLPLQLVFPGFIHSVL